jgi:ribonuclease HII
MLRLNYSGHLTEAGCDEAGRGCLAGPVFAASVILPRGYRNGDLNDSKQLTADKREQMRRVIESDAVSWAVASVSPAEIDEINILNASIRAMHRAISCLGIRPQLLLIDGNRFHRYGEIEHRCIVRGDATFLSIAAASVLAKTYRDKYMEQLHWNFPDYGWDRNKGYPTPLHRETIRRCGKTIHHRVTFHTAEQLTFALG